MDVREKQKNERYMLCSPQSWPRLVRKTPVPTQMFAIASHHAQICRCQEIKKVEVIAEKGGGEMEKCRSSGFD